MRIKAVFPVMALLLALMVLQGSRRSRASVEQGISVLTGHPLSHAAASQSPLGQKAGNLRVTLTQTTVDPKNGIPLSPSGPRMGQRVLKPTIDPLKFVVANGVVSQGFEGLAILHHKPDPSQNYSILQVRPDPTADYAILQAGRKVVKPGSKPNLDAAKRLHELRETLNKRRRLITP